MWLSGIKYGNGRAPRCFELGPGLRPRDDEVLATRSTRLKMFLSTKLRRFEWFILKVSELEFPTQGFFVFCKWWFVDVSSLCRPFSYLSSSSSSSSSFLFFLIVFLLLVSRISLFSLFEKNFFFSGEAKVSRIDTQSQKASELEFPIPRKILYFILLSHKYRRTRP